MFWKVFQKARDSISALITKSGITDFEFAFHHREQEMEEGLWRRWVIGW